MTEPDFVTSVVAANGGNIVGKTRLQKTVYLLARCGVETDFEFEYHNYGPFSADLAQAVEAAVAFGGLYAEERPGFHAVPYSVYSTDQEPPREIGGKSSDEVVCLLQSMGRCTAIDLELAATIDFLRRDGVANAEVDRTVAELKPVKSTKERLVRAHALLAELQLE